MTEAVGANPWALRQHQREINRMLARDATVKTSILKTDCNGNVSDKVNPQTPGKFLRGIKF